MKLPAIQFYPGDWHKDQGVQALDLMQRGAWFELLLMMHDSDERGVLLVNGQPMPDSVIARRLGLDNQTTNQILTTLLTYGVASRREADGALFCRRMVKDEKLRQVRTASGKKGGNPLLLNQTAKQKPTTGVKQIPTPSFSTSTSLTSSEEEGVAAEAAPLAPLSENAAEGVGQKASAARPKDAAPPTLAQVQAYAAEQHPASPDAQAEAAAFCDHYASNGWRVSGKPLWPTGAPPFAAGCAAAPNSRPPAPLPVQPRRPPAPARRPSRPTPPAGADS